MIVTTLVADNGDSRGPLPQVILASTGQDVRRCNNCLSCGNGNDPCIDLTLNEIMQAAARDDDIALSSRTLWCDELVERRIPCGANIDIQSVILALRREADMRGLASQE